MKQIAMKTFLIVLGVFFGINLWTPAYAQVVWKYQSVLNPGHLIADGEIWFSQEMEKRTDGKFKLNLFFGSALGFGGTRILGTVSRGIIESSEMFGGHCAGDLRILEVADLPGLLPLDIPLRKKAIEVVTPYHEKVLTERFNTTILFSWISEPRNIYTRKPVKSLSDLKGMKIRSIGIQENEMTKALGGSPIALAWGDIYTSLQQGIVDGYWVSHGGTYNAKFYEAAKYCYELNIGGSNAFAIANLAKYNQLPAGTQKMLKEVGREAVDKIVGRILPDSDLFKGKLKEAGMTFTKPTAEDLKFISNAVPKVWEVWLKTAEPEAKEIIQKLKGLNY